jgi:hypothetical protein
MEHSVGGGTSSAANDFCSERKKPPTTPKATSGWEIVDEIIDTSAPTAEQIQGNADAMAD